MAAAALQIYRAWRNGCKVPVVAWNEAQRIGLEYAVLCAVLDQESGGGRNVYGHDIDPRTNRPIWHGKWGVVKVTQSNYKNYKRWRISHNNRYMQGVGPMQLTYYTYQDRADRLGGCWDVKPNIRTGAEALAYYIKRHGLHEALKRYNGSEAYANQVMRRIVKWRRILNAKSNAT